MYADSGPDKRIAEGWFSDQDGNDNRSRSGWQNGPGGLLFPAGRFRGCPMKSILQHEKVCFLCGARVGLEEHHVFGGPNRKWSEKYGMSVLYMFDENQIIMAKNSLDVLNENRPNSERVKVAMEFIEKNNIFESMRNETLRDKIFIKKVIKDYAVILNDISEVKQILRERINEDVYNWVMVQTQIDQIVKDFAQSKYDTTGYNKAIEKIAEMNSEEVKKYLSDLIKDNMTVGIQIIKSNNK